MITVAFQLKLPGNIVFQVFFLEVLKRPHHRRIFCMILKSVVFQYKAFLFAAWGEGKQKIHPVMGDISFIFLPDIFAYIELRDDFQVVPIFEIKITLDDEGVEIFLHRWAKDFLILNETVPLSRLFQ